MENNYFDSNLVFTDFEADNYEEVLSKLSNILLKKGIVKEEYPEKIVEREHNYPTGLEVGEINVAVPHSDHIYVNEGKVAVAILKKPVMFNKMDDPSEEIPVSIVFMLVVAEPKAHLELLQKVFGAIQSQELLKQMLVIKDHQELTNLIKNNVIGG
ncbi:PTS sugar transporter subunit IIA [Helcococcus kunzii]|uniref:PTS EIIA type-2 domain-containing protein n=1 Tax=Helcococcus kunzii ATCC 51366 TaxID=883114 RepID=H3NQM7_9FIRM|nr:PTS sugar transporter subunit IIA [Helcococcus kunzii]EHR32357.1 hypothetical protein HMPREF9709_01638 [Helcococcus kunzii ATCC 51366]MCT1796520.1 PTS sugar transporter subunit IIA [Helcococcus kunzii]MCT1988332.1 PTS sugar transporter subunit IIA [Helcococcus kunzii]QZO76150.1 PTS sugar transporter subunit IIA [Helcococcus kunzii]